MSILLQVSDTHFGTERPEVVEALYALAEAQRPHVVVLSGDITQRARHTQFEAASRFAARLAAPALLAMPGNHDIPLYNVVSRVLRPYAGYASVFGPELEPAHESDDLLVIAVNTTRARRHKHGEVSPGQIERVAARLRAAAPGQLRVVAAHHPLHVPPGREEHNLLRGHVQAARAWAAAGADLVMGGHIHLPYVRPMSERVPDLARPLWIVQAGTAVSRRVRHDGGMANSVNVVRCGPQAEPGACFVERWDYSAAEQRFALVEQLRLALER